MVRPQDTSKDAAKCAPHRNPLYLSGFRDFQTDTFLKKVIDVNLKIFFSTYIIYRTFFLVILLDYLFLINWFKLFDVILKIEPVVRIKLMKKMWRKTVELVFIFPELFLINFSFIPTCVLFLISFFTREVLLFVFYLRNNSFDLESLYIYKYIGRP